MSVKNAKNKNTVVFLSKSNILALRYWYNRSSIALRRRGASDKEILALIGFEKILDKIDGVQKLF